MSWTDERVELLKRLWQEGRSASQIAAELAGGATRNAVIGKIHRLGLSGRGQPTTTTKRQRRTTQVPAPAARKHTTPATVGALALSPLHAPAPVPLAERKHALVVPIAKRLPIEKLTEQTCKWPIGDPGHADFHFCGHQSLEGLPYCEYHAGIAYQTPDPRRRMKRAHA
ncbi:GcrA family cell cycle regulator [Propylenella binzhouense]|uniref:GcrA cell cycle regulator n=1 Tax=Propylenella binzhouense TaxID=2555902 RepID=A0A964WUN2_9HYPH|nr:GcrA family cell cycle regulator [Propylenella binzhouense]MYZ49251.1 GcrA cell cycle regulator [Propylenella binzhouense]